MADIIRFHDGHEEPIDQAIAWAKALCKPSPVPERVIPVRTERDYKRMRLPERPEQPEAQPSATPSAAQSPSDVSQHPEGP